MPRLRKGTESRHGKRAENKTQTTLSLRKDVLAWARDQATADGRSLSNWLERVLLAMQSAAAIEGSPRGQRKSSMK